MESGQEKKNEENQKQSEMIRTDAKVSTTDRFVLKGYCSSEQKTPSKQVYPDTTMTENNKDNVMPKDSLTEVEKK